VENQRRERGQGRRNIRVAKVPHIVPLLCMGDIPHHRKSARDFSSKDWGRPIARSPQPHHHHCLVLRLDLASFDSNWKMVNAVLVAGAGAEMIGLELHRVSNKLIIHLSSE
jgi:hypothetical protein